MFTIKELAAETKESEQIIKAVAAIEAMVQPQDFWRYQELIDLLKQESIQLLMVKNTADIIVGYCLYQVVFEQAEILRIGTAPDYQRQGVAAQIFARLHTELGNRQVESLLLEVRADNIPAIALYEQQGFVMIHQRKGYYKRLNQPAIDALIMQRVYT